VKKIEQLMFPQNDALFATLISKEFFSNWEGIEHGVD
jgi:hypothetical protein